ncbi:MAG: class I SAM-dependent methyltransferase [Pseudomonadota bacterium]
MTENATLDFYDANASAYAEYASQKVERDWLGQFIAKLGEIAPGGHVLDYGCGSGWAGASMAEAGFQVDALDGSAGLAAQAKDRYGLSVRVAPFEALDDAATYNGIWASFSLLHARRTAIPGLIGRIGRALVQGGITYIGLKEGEGEAPDSLGGHYSYVSEAELDGWLRSAGCPEVEIHKETGQGYDGTPIAMLHAFARREGAA